MEALPHGEELSSEYKKMSLKYLFDQPYLNARKARWLSFLNECHFELNHINGKDNKIADALSRQDHMLYEVTLIQTNSDLHDRIRTTNEFDFFYVEFLKKI